MATEGVRPREYSRWLLRAPAPSRPAEEEEKEGEGGDAKVGQECNWTLHPPMRTPTPVAVPGGQLQPWKASHLLLWFPSIISSGLPGDPEGCVSL